jgi:hypothetical protein
MLFEQPKILSDFFKKEKMRIISPVRPNKPVHDGKRTHGNKVGGSRLRDRRS